MTRILLMRGMLVGFLAGLLVFAFARWVGEPQVEQAIRFETSMERAKGEPREPELVSREVQRGLGLLTGALVYGSALGGIFGLFFAIAHGRVRIADPRTLSATLASIGFIAIVVAPMLKYPANPPSVGNPETIGIRTGAFFLLIAFSVAAAVLAVQIELRLHDSFGGWNASLLAGATFALIMAAITHFLPDFDEVPNGFPATLLWKFRIAALTMQALQWGATGLLFGWLTDRDFRARSRLHPGSG